MVGKGTGTTMTMGTRMALATRIRTAMTDGARSPQALLQLMWLASPALPVGGFSYSDALEAAVDAGLVHDEASVAAWLGDQLRLVQQRSELPLLAAALDAWRRHDRERVLALNEWSTCTRESAEFRQQAAQMGRSLADWLRQRGATDEGDDPRTAWLTALRPAPTWTLAFALAAARSGAPAADALLAFGFSWAENAVQAAIKAVPLGQSAGQRLLGTLAAALPAVVDAALRTAEAGDSARQNLAPMLAILSARHEAQYSRLFRS